MAPPSNKTFPTFRSFTRLNSLNKADEPTEFFDCKFFPYTEPGVDPVFAVVGGAEIIVCRPSKADNAAVEVIAWFHDDDGASLNSCCWSQDVETGDPLLCVGGQTAGIRIFNVRTRELMRTLIGHGKDVNDLAVSPASPDILASASMDYTVRFWSLDPKYAKQPTMLICGGEGHREGLLTLAFHSTGRYLLTGGMDSVINLWVIPELPNEASGTDHPTILHNPHFSSSAVHTNVVDCIQWHHDLILSKSAQESKIVLWRIEDFSSDSPPPDRAPTTHEFRPTRSAFGGTYQRLLEFDAAECTPFYMRFSLFPGGAHLPHTRPVLAMANEKSRVFFWDLQAVETWDGSDADPDMPAGGTGMGSRGGRPRKRGGRGGGGGARALITRSDRESSIASSSTTLTRGAPNSNTATETPGQASTAASASTIQPPPPPAPGTSTPTPASFSTPSAPASAPQGKNSNSLPPAPNTDPQPRAHHHHHQKQKEHKGKEKEKEKGKEQEDPKQQQQPLGAGGEPLFASAAHRKFSAASPFRPLVPHKGIIVPRVGFTARQVAWSVGGEWVVVVGGQGMVVLFGRDATEGVQLGQA